MGFCEWVSNILMAEIRSAAVNLINAKDQT